MWQLQLISGLNRADLRAGGRARNAEPMGDEKPLLTETRML